MKLHLFTFESRIRVSKAVPCPPGSHPETRCVEELCTLQFDQEMYRAGKQDYPAFRKMQNTNIENVVTLLKALGHHVGPIEEG